MQKNSNRTNVLTESLGENANANFMHSILNAVIKGYSDKTIFLDIVELVRLNQISEGVLKTSPIVLKSYAKEFSKTLEYIADKIEKIVEYRDKTKVNSDEVEENVKIN